MDRFTHVRQCCISLPMWSEQHCENEFSHRYTMCYMVLFPVLQQESYSWLKITIICAIQRPAHSRHYIFSCSIPRQQHTPPNETLPRLRKRNRANSSDPVAPGSNRGSRGRQSG